MFTGIIADVGTIADKQDREGGLRLRIDTSKLDMSDVRLGVNVINWRGQVIFIHPFPPVLLLLLLLSV